MPGIEPGCDPIELVPTQRWMGGGAGGKSASFEVGILPRNNVGAAADSGGGGGDFVRWCTDAIGSAGCVVYARAYPAATTTTATTAATAAC